MTTALFLLLVVLLVVYAFEYINGFHDTANAIATVVSTKVLTPRQALLLAASMNLVGAFFGQAVAKTIHSGIVDDKVVAVTTLTVFCAMLAGIIWNLITWWFGMPSSSTHALVGGLIGASLGAANGNWKVLICRDRLGPVDFSKQMKMKEDAIAIVVTMVSELRKKLHLERIKELNAKLQKVEGDADKLMLECLRVLYTTEKDAVVVIIMKDLYDLMEKVVDRCRDAGNVIAHIILKNS